MKDVVIQAGRKHHPSDIEEAAERVPSVRGGATAAFGVTEADGAERIVVAAEWRGPTPDAEARGRISALISDAVAAAIGAPPDRIVLLPPGSVPKTSSGKIRRGAARALYLAGGLGRAPRPALLQAARLGVRAAAAQGARLGRRVGAWVYGVLAFAVIAAVLAIGAGLLLLLPRGAARAARRLGRGTARVALTLAGLRPHVAGRERLPDGPAVLVANHASYLDIPVLAAVLPEGVRHTAKVEVGGWPALGRLVRQGGHILVDRAHTDRAVGALEEARALLARGEQVILFPEATFTRAAGLRPFRLGAFQLAALAGVPVVPIALRGTRRAYPDGAWLPRLRRIDVEIGDPIPPGPEPGIARIVKLRDRAAAAIAASIDEPVLESFVAGPES